MKATRIFSHISIVSAVMLLCLICTGPAYGNIIINAPMTDTNSASWVMGGNPNSAILTGNGTIDPVGSGWLRLTNNTGNQAGFVYNTTTFDLSAGALIQFDCASWGGNGADGFSVFLFDANVPAFNIGAFGGSIGYAQKLPPTVNPAVPGVSGGYVGIGIDEFGNFASASEGRYLGPGATPNAVTVRGSVVGFGGGAVGQTQNANSYPWIATSANNGSLWVNSGTRPVQISTDYRKAIIKISSAPNPVVNAWIQFGYNTTPVQMITNQALPAIPASQQLRIGFGASTGGSTNYHEVRNLMISDQYTNSAIDLGITKTAVTTGTSTAITGALVGNSFDYLITARNYGPNSITATGVGIVDTFSATVTPGNWTCTASGGANCGAASGNGNLNTTANLPMNGYVTYKVPVTVNAMPVGNLLSNTASLTIPGAVTDYFPNNNSATATINVYARPTVTKSFAPASVPLNTNSTLTITLTNPNSIAATGVAFTDTYPSTNLKNSAAAAVPQCGGTVTGASGASALSLTGGTIPANGSCTVTVNVNSAVAATYNNTIGIGGVTTTNIGSNSAAANGTLVVLTPPTVTKSFAAASMAAGDNTNLTVTIGNTNSSAITLTSALTDTFPANMTIGTAGNTGTCTGVTATAGDNKFTMANGTSIPPGSCTVMVNVTSTATGTNTIAAGGLVTSAGSNAAAASASLTVYSAATLTKSYSASTIATGATSNLKFTITNGSGRPAQSNLAFTDVFPAGLIVTGVSAVAGNGCGGTPSFTPSTVTLANGAITGGAAGTNGPCTFTATIRGDSGGTYINNSARFSNIDGGLITSTTTATLNVYDPPTLSKSFLPTSIAVGGTSVMALILGNPATNPGAITTTRADDTFPAGLALQNATFTFTPAACGTVTRISGAASAAGDNNVRFTAASIAAGATCQVQMNVTSSIANNFVNTTNPPTATGPIALTGTAASATLNGTQAPTITKSFAVANLASGGNTGMTVAISNTNAAAITLTGAFTDTFPAGMTIGTAGNTGTCTGVTATAGAGSFVMANGTAIPAGGCTIIVNVTSSTAGAAINSIPANALQTTVGNNAAASAALNVYGLPTVNKVFTPTSISYGGTSSIAITVTNPAANPGNLTGVSISDSYTGTLRNNAAGSVSCTGGGSAVLTGGVNNGTTVGFNTGTIAPGGSCTITQSVTATSTNNNSTTALAVTGPVALTGTAASATLTVAPIAPTVAKSFAATNLASGGNTTLTVTIGNANAAAIALTSAFTDTFPAGMTIGTAGNSGTCTGVTATAGASNVTMANGTTIPAGGCTIIVNVTSSTAGAAANTIASGDLQTLAGSNTTPASATLNIYAPPTEVKSFAPASISSGGTSSMTITVTNPAANPGNLTGVSIGDTYTGTLRNNAAGSVSCTGAGSAVLTGGVKNGTTVGFNIGTIAPGGSCTITQSVTATSTNNNSTTAPAVTGPVALTGTAASATLTTTLLPAPGVAKSFAPTQITISGNSTLTVTLTNTSSIDIIGVAFSDTLPSSPAQMSIPPSAVLSNSCGGTGTIAANKLSFSISGATIPANSSCTVSVPVTASTLGTYPNTTSTVTSTNAATSTTASAILTVALLAPPTVLKTFAPNQMGVNGTSVLTVTLTNSTTTAITGAAFTDNYPAGMFNTGSANGTTTCAGGTVTAANNGNSLALSGATVPASSSCTVTVNVTSNAAGAYVNSTGPVTTSNAGTGTSASATINVLQPPSVSKAFAPEVILANGTSIMTITLTNPNNIAITGAAFSDIYPSGLINTASPTGATSCTSGTVTAASNGSSVALAGATIPGSGSCTVTVNVTSAANGIYTNNTGPINTTNAGTAAGASATLYVGQVALSKSYSTASMPVTGNSVLTFTLTNSTGRPAQTNLTFTDTLTVGSGLTVTGVTPLSGAGCSATTPTFNATGNPSVTLTGATMAPATTACTFTATVRGNTAGTYPNLTANISGLSPAINASNLNSSIDVYALPLLTILKSANMASGNPGQTIVYTVQIANTGAGSGTNVVLDDSLSPYGAFGVNSYGAGVPFSFIDSLPASGLTLGTPEYSFDNGLNWTSVTPPGGVGAPAGYNGNVTNWRIPMTGTIRSGGSFTLNYQAIIK